MALALDVLDPVGDNARLFLAIPDPVHDYSLTAFGLSPQGLAQPALILRDQARGRAQYGPRGAVVLFKTDDLRAGEILLEAQDVADLGPAPRIDRLVVIADAGDVAVALGQEAQPKILGDVGVLILVHQEVPEAVLVIGQHLRVLGENR